MFRFLVLPANVSVCYAERLEDFKTDVIILRDTTCANTDLPHSIQFEVIENSLVIKTDIIHICLFLLTREEEKKTVLDKHGRFPLDQSILKKSNDLPVLDDLVHDLEQLVHRYFPGKEDISLPQKVIFLSHDVEKLFGKSLLRYAFWLARGAYKNQLKAELSRISRWVNSKRDWLFDSLEEFMKIEAEYCMKSTFYFLALEHYISREGRKYRLQDPRVAEAIRKIKINGWEIGLHVSYAAHLKRDAIVKQKKMLEEIKGSTIKTVRNHYLRFMYPETFRLYEDLHFESDATIGWAESFGFRAGTAYPFKAFDIANDCELQIREIPLIVMDGPFWAKYNDDNARCEDIVKCLIELTHKATKRGVFSLLWHTTNIDTIDNSKMREMYILSLKAFEAEDYRSLTSSEICSEYDQHENFVKSRLRFL